MLAAAIPFVDFVLRVLRRLRGFVIPTPRLAAEGVPHEAAALQRRIELTDRLIDGLVYELYGLTAAEIAVVAGT